MTFVTDQDKATEATDIERRALAHERVLQALIAYMARSEPHFIDHLIERFVDPMRMARHEQDYRDTDDYAEEFVRKIMRLGEARALPPKEFDMVGAHGGLAERDERIGPPIELPARVDRVQVRQRSGIWEVQADGKFHGDYVSKEQAFAAAAMLKLSL
jgi:hypothetical protein